MTIVLLLCLPFGLLIIAAAVAHFRSSHSVAINWKHPSEALSSVVIHKTASGRGDLSGIPLSGNRCAESGGLVFHVFTTECILDE